MKNKKSASILARLGANASKNQNHVAATDAEKKDPNTPLPDVTKEGAYESDGKRPADKSDGKDPIDKSSGAPGQDDSTAKQDAAPDHVGIYKGKGSVETGSVIGKKLKESFKPITVDVENVNKLFEGDEVDEATVKSAVELYEAAVTTAVKEQIEHITEQAVTIMAEMINEEVEALEEHVQEYLDVAVVEWAEDNKLVIEESTRVNLAESFMGDLVELMEAYNIQLPEESVDLYEEAVEAGNKVLEENKQLTAELEAKTEELQVLNKSVFIENYIAEHKFTLAESERLRNISSELEFKSDTDFENKLNKITESYSKVEKKDPVNENLTESDSFETVSDTVDNVSSDPYVDALYDRIRKSK